MNNKPIYIVYKTTNKLNSKIYIGVHKTFNIDTDDYCGSGVLILAAIRKHGRHNFEREILYIYHSEAVAYKRESYIVTEEFLSRKDTYNMKLGGFGGYSNCHNPVTRAKTTKINIESGHYSRICKNSIESNIKRASTFNKKAIIKYPILGHNYQLIDPNQNVIKESTLIDICIDMFSNRLAVKRYTRLFNEEGIPRVIKRGKWKGFVVKLNKERSTTSA